MVSSFIVLREALLLRIYGMTSSMRASSGGSSFRIRIDWRHRHNNDQAPRHSAAPMDEDEPCVIFDRTLYPARTSS